MDPIVIVGSGLAGYTVAREFRKLDKETSLLLVSQDAGDFYSKPTLSNALAQKRTVAQLVTMPAAEIAAQLAISLRSDVSVRDIDCAAHCISVDGESIAYRALVLACGADPIRLAMDGDATDSILSVNDLGDYAVFRQRLEGRHRIAILGGGLIGCEFANDLISVGHAVTVIDPAPRPLASLLPEIAGQSMLRPLETAGVRWRFGRATKVVEHDSTQLLLTLDDGSKIEADLILSAVGLRPRTQLAREAGISVERGIQVDDFARTSASAVYALGDCAQYPAGVMPYVMPIMHAARAIAHTLAGTPTQFHFPAMPVTVKTPAWPVVVQPVPVNLGGAWCLESQSDDGLKMIFKDVDGEFRGFVLAGGFTKERMTMTKLLSVQAVASS